MSLLWNWFWTSKKVSAAEREQSSSNHRALFNELRGYFKDHGTARRAERKFDFDEVYETLTDDMVRVDEFYEDLEFNNGQFIFPNKETKDALRAAIEKYLDDVVVFREFVHENAVLRERLAQNLLNYPKYEGFYFVGHYWQLFRRDLRTDLLNPGQALAAIQGQKESEFSTDEESSSEEYYVRPQ